MVLYPIDMVSLIARTIDQFGQLMAISNITFNTIEESLNFWVR